MNPNFPAHKILARILAPLGTPAQRAWFVVATLGLLLMLGGSAVFAIRTDYGRYGTDDFSRLVFDPEYFQYSGFRGSFGSGISIWSFDGHRRGSLRLLV